MPLWAAVATAAAAYALRSALRGWDFRFDLPLDAVLGLALGALVALRLAFGRRAPLDGRQDENDLEVSAERQGPGRSLDP